MNDLDSILAVVENPTRRRILRAIVREPHYPLQLSKELGISQQAIVKNLDVMERAGMVVSYRESSDRGPERILYKPNSAFSITIDMRDGMFDTRIVLPDDTPEEEQEAPEELESMRREISEIDAKLQECEKTRSALVKRRNDLMKMILNCEACFGMDYMHRSLLYEMMNKPDVGVKEMSRDLGLNEGMLDEMVSEILKAFENRMR